MNRDVCEHFNPVDLPCDKCKRDAMRDDIIRMAREAGFETANEWERHPNGFFVVISRFAHLVYESVFRDANIAASRTILDAAVLEEREACAKVCEEFYSIEGIAQNCAAAIRERSNP